MTIRKLFHRTYERLAGGVRTPGESIVECQGLASQAYNGSAQEPDGTRFASAIGDDTN